MERRTLGAGQLKVSTLSLGARGVSMVRVALAWLAAQPGVTSVLGYPEARS